MYRRNGFDSRRLQRTPRLEMAVWQDLVSDTGHMHMPGYDPNDPYSCTCYPKPSSIQIPSMVYDEIRCPHPEKHHLQPAQDDVFAYPWTVQTYEPPFDKNSYRPMSLPPRPPMSAKTAPPYVGMKAKKLQSVAPPPNSAPDKVKVPKLDLNLLEQPQRSKVVTTPTLTTIGEAQDDFAETKGNYPTITQYDSVSQVLQRRYSSYYRNPAPTPLHFKDPDRNMMRRTPVRDPPYKGMPPRTREVITRDLPTRNSAYYSRFEYSPPPQVRGSPGMRSYTATMDPVPTRQFEGHYVDPKTGKDFKYDVRYGKRDLEGNRSLITA
ncbi:uncharacterized protein [Haliotis cracherodii]|uniref:uncharacterized protein n=1 Tax=Haliotis cracherodii TaxID=6455 RepID=UPI0039EA16A6